MKVRTYIRVAHDKRNRKTWVQANIRPNTAPLTNSRGDVQPTVAFALMLDIPDAMFAQAEQIIAEIKVPEEQAQIAAEVREFPRAAEA